MHRGLPEGSQDLNMMRASECTALSLLQHCTFQEGALHCHFFLGPTSANTQFLLACLTSGTLATDQEREPQTFRPRGFQRKSHVQAQQQVVQVVQARSARFVLGCLARWKAKAIANSLSLSLSLSLCLFHLTIREATNTSFLVILSLKPPHLSQRSDELEEGGNRGDISRPTPAPHPPGALAVTLRNSSGAVKSASRCRSASCFAIAHVTRRSRFGVDSDAAEPVLPNCLFQGMRILAYTNCQHCACPLLG